MEIISILIIVTVSLFLFTTGSERKKISSKNKMIVDHLVEEANKYLTKISTARTVNSKMSHYNKALIVLRKAGQYPECKHIIANYDEVIERIKRTKKILPVEEHLERAQKYSDKTALEKRSLLSALYEIRTRNITDKDFQIAGLKDDVTGEVVTISRIKNWLDELGYK